MNEILLLIVEDDPIALHDIISSLRKSGYTKYKTCATGEKALELADEFSPDIVLMNTQLSGSIDGIEAAQILIQKHSIPVVFFTSSNDISTINRSSQAYPYGYIVKPASAQAIHIAIELAISRYQLELQLKKTNNLFSLTLNSIVEAVIAIDDNHKIIFINDQALKMIGTTSQQIQTLDIEKIYKTTLRDPSQQLDCTLVSVMESGEPLFNRDSHFLITSDNTIIPISENCSPLINSRNIIFGAVIVFQDISHQKQSIQEQLINKKQESMSKLARNLSHEFNNILTGVIGNVSILKMLLETNDPQILETVAEIEKSSIRARDLGNQIRRFSKGGIIQKVTTDIVQLVTDCAASFCEQPDISVKIESNLNSANLIIDPVIIHQALESILINACESIEGPGLITISISTTYIGKQSPLELNPGNYIRITIKDSGSGIKSNEAEQIFEPYFTTKAKNRGLGLTTSLTDIKAHQGSIVMEKSNPGSTFSIYLPQNKEFQTNIVNDTIKESKHIIVVDDEKSILLMLDKILTSLGYSPHTFTVPDKALDFAKNFDKTIIATIIDLSIPGNKGGALLLSELRRFTPQSFNILISGHNSDNPVISEYYRYGFDALLNKPFSVDDLISILNSNEKQQ